MKSSKEEAAERALAAMADLIVETVKGDGLAKFAEVVKFGEIAQRLKLATSRRVADFPKRKPPEDVFLCRNEDVHGNSGDEEGPDPDALVEQQAHANIDSQSMLRNVMLMVSPVFQAIAEKERNAAAEREASELESLLQSKAKIAKGLTAFSPESMRTIENRVVRLVSNMELRNKANPPPELFGDESSHDESERRADLATRIPAQLQVSEDASAGSAVPSCSASADPCDNCYRLGSICPCGFLSKDVE